MNSLEQKRCLPCEGIGKALDRATAEKFIQELNGGWQISPDNRSIKKDFRFKNFYHTMAFVNAIAWMANLENHHPDLEVGYNHCAVKYSTHAIGGLTENDFICAKKVDVTYSPYEEKKYV